MKVIVNDLLPVKGYVAINLFGVVFARREEWDPLPDVVRRAVIRHEATHTAQGRELLWIGFYLVYLLEWLGRLLIMPRRAYRSLSFEREAYAHEWEVDYLETREPFAQWRHLR